MSCLESRTAVNAFIPVPFGKNADKVFPSLIFFKPRVNMAFEAFFVAFGTASSEVIQEVDPLK